MEIFELIKNIVNPQWILNYGGIWLVIAFVFLETGFFVGFFLPGDSLLFVTGMVLSTNKSLFSCCLSLGVIPSLFFLVIAAILGNYVGYWFGNKSGTLLFKKKDSLIFKKKYLLQAQDFYKKNGASTIFIARFLPIIRTFAPIIAGMAGMNKRVFAIYNVLSGLLWILSIVLLGYFLGRIFPWLNNYLELIVIGIILLTTLPVFIKIYNHKKR